MNNTKTDQGGSLERVDGRAGRSEDANEERWWRVEIEDEGKWAALRHTLTSAKDAIGYANEFRAGFPGRRFRAVAVVARTEIVAEPPTGSPIAEICRRETAPGQTEGK